MTEENQKNDLGDLSRNWHDRLIQLRFAMAKSYGAFTPSQSPQPSATVEIPPDNELFVAPVEHPPVEQLFDGNENFYKSLENTPSNPVHPQTFNAQSFNPSLAPKSKYKRFSSVQIILAAAILIVTGILFYELFVPPSKSAPKKTLEAHQPVKIADSLPAHAEVAPPEVQKHLPETPQAESSEPLSLKVAQSLYLNENYSGALQAYTKLHENLAASPKEQLMKDYLQLQIAICLERTADYNQASVVFRKIINSDSPAVRAIAFYHCGLLENLKKEFLDARTKAYQALAVIDAIDYNKQWTDSLKRDCSFLAAQALTCEVLTLCDADKNLPQDVWPHFGTADDIFLNIDDTELRKLLASGADCFEVAALAPQIKKFDHHNDNDVFNITSDGASVHELISRFASNAGADVVWNLEANDVANKRVVYLHLLSATVRQFADIASGSAGLVAVYDNNSGLNIYNPRGYTSSSQYISILSREALAVWQEFMLRFPQDSRLANVHFAIALLNVPQKNLTQSIAEYKLVANGFTRSHLAPCALLNSSKIKTELKDYKGAYEDLKQLVEQFSDSQTALDAYLTYAQTAANANLLEEAFKLYTKAYNFAVSNDSQISAAFGAGKISYQLKDYESSEKWLTRYINLASSSSGKNLYLSYLYLGKTYIGMNRPDAACQAFRLALLGVPLYLPKDEYIDFIPSLVDSYIKEGNFIQALEILEAVDTPALSLNESVDVLTMQSRVLRAMGLVDKAIVVLGDRAEFMLDLQMKAKIYYQLSQCYADKGDLNRAHRLLSEILVIAQPGTLMQQAALNLAEICRKLDQNSQAVSVCIQLLDLQPADDIKQKALRLLAEAHNQNENYDKAALALLGQWK